MGKAEASFPNRKISETLMEFAEPILGFEDEPPTKEKLETVLKLAFTIWNSIVLDTVNGNSHFTDELRHHLAGHAMPADLLEQMISRKRTRFGNDQRMIGNFRLFKKNGQWRLRAEARKPPTVD